MIAALNGVITIRSAKRKIQIEHIIQARFLLQEVNGQPYKAKHGFTCKAQAEKFQDLLQEMAARPQDYVSLGGRMTRNSVEGFHGLALMYRDKRTDLGHTHYVCKTNIAICHKVRECDDLVRN